MKIKKLINKYNQYEKKELARRATKKRKLVPYNALRDKKVVTKKLSATSINKALGNPYGIEKPKIKKIKPKRAKKVVIIYK